MDLIDQLYSRCPVDQIRFDKETPFETLQEHLLKIKDINEYYIKKVLKKIIDLGLYEDDTDWIYDEYVTLLNVTEQDQYSKIDSIRYFFDSTDNNNDKLYVDIYEKPNLISASGTTGFRTWEASLFLCSYILANKQLFEGNNVLELGCGTGICSILLSKLNIINENYVTDGDSELVSNQLVKNFELNDILLKNREQKKIKLQRLWWNEDTIPSDIDIVIGADITFDSTLFDALCQCLLQCLQNCSMCLISATIRNQETIDSFISITKSLGMRIEEIERTTTLKHKKNLLAPIVIYKITK
ncbi:hypothetical protein C6P45_005382 [Maudiozyma exigua]|uniref:FAM86 N-terminal domain-containing protein n=1 Tax=Maudiozyma exigua TaxID=34358 RepID=A0A9P7BAW8_MAUEX|nr:hypothetical protein C6P45_005382 [Kazachstania exigua]